MSAVVTPPKATTSTPAATASTMMPLENTSRSPRLASWVGMKRSWARIEPMLGNALNAVLAASTRISAVVAWT